MAPLLELSHVDAGYPGQLVLHGVSLSLGAGEAWVVLGPNGAGKSTLVRVVMGMLAPSGGEVRFDGRGLSGQQAREVARQVAWVPQVTDDATDFTGLELALLGRAPHLSTWGVPGAKDEALARAALEELGVGALAARRLSQVSGGERRRVWLARALVQAPRLLVLDEPTAFLDVRHQVEALRVVQRRAREGLGVLAVLHDVNLARHLATHALLLKDGRVMAAGPCGEVLTQDALSALYDVPMEQAPAWAPRW